MSYADKATRAAFIQIYACIDSVDMVLRSEFHNKTKVKRNLNAIKNQAWKACDAIMADLDEDQRSGIIRFTKNSNVVILPKSDVRLKDELYIVPRDVFDRLILAPGNECCFCTKEGKEIKRCQRRKDLASCGLATSSSGECPYQM